MQSITTQKWYRPREIAKLGLIQNISGSNNEHSNYNFILNLIKSGRLKAKNVGAGKVPIYQVSEGEVKRYHEEA
jgi:hypothetical protein